jgi:hypothetical protein
VDDNWNDPPPEALTELAMARDVETRRGVAQHPKAPSEALLLLLSDDDLTIAHVAYRHPNLQRDKLTEGRWWQNFVLRSVVADNPDSPAWILDRLAGDEGVDIRWLVAANPATSAAALDRLSTDEDRFVREAVARHPHTTHATLARLADDSEARTLMWVARHPATPDDVKVVLALRGYGPVDLAHSGSKA